MFDVCRTIFNQFKTCVDVSEEIFTQVSGLYKDICGVDPVVKYTEDSECEEYKFEINDIGIGYFSSAIVINTIDGCPYISIYMQVGTEGEYDHDVNVDIYCEDVTHDCDVCRGKVDDDGSDIVRFFNGAIDIINNVCKEYKQTCPTVEKSEVSTDKEMTDSEFQDKIDNLYPLCIISDRYTGCYSGGNYTAWTTGIDYIPRGIFSDDVECALTWAELKTKRDEHKIAFGVGDTPDEALRDLIYWNEKWRNEI